ncbi:MAG: hypothetical protein N2440_00365 [Actinobacteria bacterium]|nr:hypothetical protein [Actinomycetota bacterium]
MKSMPSRDLKENLSTLKIILLVFEIIVFVYSILNVSTSDWSYQLGLLFLLAVASYLIDIKFRDMITTVSFSSCVHLLPIISIYSLYGFYEAIIANTLSYFLGLAVLRSRNKERAIKANESLFVFLAIVYLLESLFDLRTPNSELGVVLRIAFFAIAFYAHLVIESYFESKNRLLPLKSYFKQVVSVGFPYHSSILALLISLSYAIVQKHEISTLLPLAAWLFLLGCARVFAGIIHNDRNRYAMVFEALSLLSSKSEKEEKKISQMIDYARRMSHESNMKSGDFDSTILAAMIHDFGRSGIDVYSVDSIIEDIRSFKGDPLHAERASEAIEYANVLPEVSEIIKYHHKYQDKDLFARLRRSLRFQASLINVSESFSELMVENEEEFYDERNALKDLKKNSGWEYDPKALRMLRNVLKRLGLKRI